MPDMADNAPIEVIRSHGDGEDSNREKQPSNPQQSPPNAGDEKYQRDVCPDGGYGWVCVTCVFWINANTWGINSVSQNYHVLLGKLPSITC